MNLKDNHLTAISRIKRALEGVYGLKEHVNPLLVINNEKLFEMYSDLNIGEAFSKVDNVIYTAVKDIAEQMTLLGKVDVETALNSLPLKNNNIFVPVAVVNTCGSAFFDYLGITDKKENILKKSCSRKQINELLDKL